MHFISLGIALIIGRASSVSPETVTHCDTAVNLVGNPFSTRALHPNSRYQAEVLEAVTRINNTSLKQKGLKVAEVGSFLWLDYNHTPVRPDPFESELKLVACSKILGIIIKDVREPLCSTVPVRDRLDIATYKKDYIDTIANTISNHPNVAIAAIIEPGVVADLILNGIMNCQGSKPSDLKEALSYALKKLNRPNVALYIDVGHGGVLGWEANLKSAVSIIAEIYEQAGNPSQLRGFATNVASYNAWDKHPGEFECSDDSKCNNAQNEKRAVQLLSTALSKVNIPNYAVVDTSRNAVQGLRLDWFDYCNIFGAGFGVRPTNITKDPQTDAFVWVKNGGESDGTSDPNDFFYQSVCGKPDAFKPSPSYGVWNQPYFETLVAEAVPAF